MNTGTLSSFVYKEREGSVVWRALLFTSEGSGLMIWRMKVLWFAWPLRLLLPASDFLAAEGTGE